MILARITHIAKGCAVLSAYTALIRSIACESRRIKYPYLIRVEITVTIRFL